jgi:hypothetical protein
MGTILMTLSWPYINDGLSCTVMGTRISHGNSSAQQWKHLHFVGSSLRLAIMANVCHQVLGRCFSPKPVAIQGSQMYQND